MTISIRPMQPDDWLATRQIYLEGIATGNATFQTEAPSWEYWDANHLQACRLVAENNGDVLGWAVLGAISSRPVYRGVAEVSVYVAERARGTGVGKALMQELVAQLQREDFWTLQSGIFPENHGSLALHRGAAFREVGRREKIAMLAGQWRDVVLLERRIPTETP
ncbi:GNAT family N-acetyltransferase [Burkholderia pseudomallei]|uniref:GNAT family N-acetyltransferase n=2 Tax=Burkholderia pseudomallei TaxID=28450 RepID=UPI00053686F2|nr:GNAT family N-acetyltransferase [Burkholderia pseudomallei]KGU72143.1 acetyltransferase family protein [Burkholderia pseudomallei MSHR4304]KGV29584.1 acetyltransferase family protein [Burkholderia pseudomallei MSHR4308]KGW06776.1 acetyltransferase family protein [Burkholderia pseudomallei MSHR4303]ONC62723.1 phosphinothricin acetyltransferase [Burkholderia pseudomallei]